jgi:hypothetical protein
VFTNSGHVRLDIADIAIKHNQKKAKSSLENAKQDGHICFKSDVPSDVFIFVFTVY